MVEVVDVKCSVCALKDKEDATIAMRALVVATKESIETNIEAFKKQTLESILSQMEGE